MFNSKKFSDIKAKQNSRYDNRYIDKEESYIDTKNTKENDPIQVIDIIEEKHSFNGNSEQKSYKQSQFTNEYDDRIKKVEIRDSKRVNKSRELLFEDLANSSHHTIISSQKSIIQRSTISEK